MLCDLFMCGLFGRSLVEADDARFGQIAGSP